MALKILDTLKGSFTEKSGQHLNRFDVHSTKDRLLSFTNQHALEAEALKLGCTCYRDTQKSFAAMSSAGRRTGFISSRLEDMPNTVFKAAVDKVETKKRLSAYGVPVPQGAVFDVKDTKKAMAYAKELGYPIVVKPASGRMGMGVFANIDTDDSFQAAFKKSGAVAKSSSDPRLIVESHVAGRDFRVFATREKAFSVIERIPAHIVGDGKTSVEKLVEKKNAERLHNPYTARKPISLETEPNLLEALSLSPASIPEKGQEVFLSSVANISRGGDSIESFQSAHPDVLQAAVRAVQSIDGLEYAGVDILMEDPSVAPEEQSFSIIEINGTPDILMHPFPCFGTPSNAPAGVLRYVLGNAAHDFPAQTAADNDVDDREIVVRIVIEGDVIGFSFDGYLRKRLKSLELKGQAREAGTKIEAWARGPARRIAILTGQCIRGSSTSKPTLVVTTPLSKDQVAPLLRSFKEYPRVFPASIRTAKKQGHDQDVAAYVANTRTKDIPVQALDRARLLLLDTLGVTILGAQHADAKVFRDLAFGRADQEQSTVVGTGLRRSATTAAFCGSAMAQIHDFNDGHRESAYYFGSRHPGRAIIPTALALAEARQLSATDVLTAIVLGYDVACKLRSGRTTTENTSARSDMYGVAATAGRLQGLSLDALTAAIGLAGFHQPATVTGLRVAQVDAYRVGLRSTQALNAVEVAAAGQPGPNLLYDRGISLPFGLSRDLHDFEVMNTYVKLWPACRMVHSAVGAALDLKRKFDINPAEITRVEIQQPPSGMSVAKTLPKLDATHKRAQFNIYYCVASALLHNDLNITQFSAAAIGDLQVNSLAKKIKVTAEKSFSALYPKYARPSRVTIFLKSGKSVSQRIDIPKGDPLAFPSDTEIVNKFRKNSEDILGPRQSDDLVSALFDDKLDMVFKNLK